MMEFRRPHSSQRRLLVSRPFETYVNSNDQNVTATEVVTVKSVQDDDDDDAANEGDVVVAAARERLRNSYSTMAMAEQEYESGSTGAIESMTELESDWRQPTGE